MVSIAVELLRGDRVATAAPALASPEDTKGNFAHSLLANGIESVSKPVIAEARANKNAVATEVEARKKNATTGLDLATGSRNYEEIESGLSEANGRSMPVGARGTVIANGQLTAKAEAASNTTEVKEVDGSEIKKPDISETSKVGVSERTKLKASETKNPKIGATKLERAKAKDDLDGFVTASGPVGDETRVGDAVSVQSLTSSNGTSVPLNNLKDSDVLPIIPGDRPAGDKHSESAMTAPPIAQREIKETQDNANHPATLSESSSDLVSTVSANVEQTKNGAVVVSADLAGSGAAGAGKTEVGIGSVITAVQHVGTDLPGQGPTASFGAAGHHGSVAEATRFVNSHPSTYSGEQMATGESRPGLLGATPTSLEVGIANGTHGWLKIRAEMEGGVVTASLSPGSMAGQEMLHRELPSLAAYLQEEKLGVNTLVLKPAELLDSMGTNSGAGPQRQGQPSQQQSDSARDGIGTGDKSGFGGPQQRPIYEGWNSFDGGFLPAMADNVGSWLNVRV